MFDKTTVFSQIMELVPWRRLQTIVDRYNGDHHARNIKTHQLFRVMVAAQLTQQRSLRSTVECLRSIKSRWHHMGITSISLNGLAQANQQRDWRIFAQFAQILLAMALKLHAKTPSKLKLPAKVFALDSTTIDLCLSLFPWADFRSTKAAVKVHTLLDVDTEMPVFIRISRGKTHDVNILDELPIYAGTYYVMDKAYIDYARLYALDQGGAWFVVRAKSNTKLHRQYSRPVDKPAGVRCDQTVVFDFPATRKNYPDQLRRVVFFDVEKNRRFVFLTNNFLLPAETIAQLYKRRWDVELFFKWIKQNLRIQTFFGRSENAVKSQIWIAISTYLLVAILRQTLQINASMSKILHILHSVTFDYSPIFTLFDCHITKISSTDSSKQLFLPGF